MKLYTDTNKNHKHLIINLVLISIVFCFVSCNTVKDQDKLKTKVRNVLILGNSIVIHPPLPEIGWNNNWGMAASTQDSDFVHRLQNNIHQINPNIKVSWGSISEFERDYVNYDLNKLSQYRNYDMIILKISENVSYKPNMKSLFIENYDNLINYLNPNHNSIIILVEGFWPSPVNEMIKEYATEKNFPFVPIADLYNDKSNTAIGLFENEGVSRHPSDKGMRKITNRIWETIKIYFQ